MPDEFYQSIRHISSFRNKAEYEVYFDRKVIEWNEKHNPDKK